MGSTWPRLERWIYPFVCNDHARRRFAWLAFGSGLVCVLISFAALVVSVSMSYSALHKVQGVIAAQQAHAVKEHLHSYVNGLYGMRAALHAKGLNQNPVDTFYSFLNARNVLEEFPGVQTVALGIARPEGTPASGSLNPVPHIVAAYPKQYEGVLVHRNTGDYGHLQEEFSKAVDEGTVFLTGGVPELGKESLTGAFTALVLPVYSTPGVPLTVEERRKAYWGGVGFRLNMSNFVQELDRFESLTRFGVQLKFRDIQGASFVLKSKGYESAEVAGFFTDFRSRTFEFHEMGGLWSLDIKPTVAALRAGAIDTVSLTVRVLLCLLVGLTAWLVLQGVFNRLLAKYAQERSQALEQDNRVLGQQIKTLTLSVHNAEDFIGILSHEVHNPLTAIQSVQHLLEHTPLSPEQRKLADFQRLALNTALDTLNNTLDLKKLELSALEIEEIEFEPLLVIKEIDSLLLPQCKTRGVMLRILVDSEVPRRIRSDPLRLKQVLLNLLNNAVKFTPSKGQVTLSCGAKKLVQGVWQLHFKIQDTGRGMSKEELAKLFKPYTQGDKSVARQFGGTGLGLAIAQRIVRSFGGEIQVSSQQGVGTCFEFVMTVPEVMTKPEKLDCPDSMDLERRLDTLQSTYHRSNQRMNLLYVDDNDFNLLVAREMVQAKGSSMEVFSDPMEALAHLEATQQPFDLIITDLNMPGLSGLEFAQRVKAMPSYVNQRVIGVTASQPCDSEKDPVLDAVFSKPLRMATIQEWIG